MPIFPPQGFAPQVGAGTYTPPLFIIFWLFPEKWGAGFKKRNLFSAVDQLVFKRLS